MHIYQTSIHGNPNVGLNIFCNNSFALIGKSTPDEEVQTIQEVLGVPVHKVTVAGTDLVGVFTVGNEERIIVPSIIDEKELAHLRELGIKVGVVDVGLTALGNNILCKDNKALVNPEFTDKEIKQIKEQLRLDSVERFSVDELGIIGGLVAYNKKGAAIYRDIRPQKKEELEKFLGVPCEESTVNMGSPFISSGVACNDNGFIMGNMSGGPELYNMENILGFTGDKNE